MHTKNTPLMVFTSLIEHFQPLSAATHMFTRSIVLPAEASDFAVNHHSQSTSTNGSADWSLKSENLYF
jgi:hypothetical protein